MFKHNFRLAGVFAIFALLVSSVPANAVVTNVTISGIIDGLPATQMAKNDVVEIKAQAPISLVGPAVQTVTSLWAPQGFELQSSGDITYPDGWSLEYTTDGEAWSNTEPIDLSTVAGVRASGAVDSLGSGMFVSTAQAELLAAGSASGAGGSGDGYNVAFGNGTLINAYHHSTVSLTMACHLVTGERCDTYQFSNSNYQTNHGSSVFYNKKTNHAYAFVRNKSDGSYGVACFDYGDLAAVTNCAIPYTKLTNGGASNQGWGRSTRAGNYLWSLDGVNATLMCFNMSLNGGQGGACPSDNNKLVGTPGGNGQAEARVTATQNKVFFTVNNLMGCYDPATHAYCSGSTPISISGGNRHSPIPVENADGSFFGACDITSRKCLNTSGTEVTILPSLDTFWDSTTPAAYAYLNLVDFATANHRLYYIDGTVDLSCYDFSTQLACDGFDGSQPEFSALTYTANIDPSNPRCVWVNQDSGTIVPVDPTTGAVGCTLGQGVIIPVSANVKRMSCDPEASVLTWNEVTITLPDGIDRANVKVNIRDSEGTDIPGWTNLVIPESGVIDISTLDTNISGLDPVFNLVGENGVTGTDLEPSTTQVTFTATEPEVCVNLTARSYCEGIDDDPTSQNVPNGVFAASSVTVPDGGGASVSSESELTIPGTNPDTQCPAVLPGTPQNPLIVYFSPISPKLSPAAKSSIARMVNANAFTRVTCAATTQGDRTIKWLANERAKAVCNYVKSLKPRMKTKVSVGKPGIQASHRAVLLTGS